MLRLRFCFAFLAVLSTSAFPASLRAGVPVPNLTGDPTPAPVPMACAELSQAFTTIATGIQTVAERSRSAAYNAKGLGYFSPGRHFRSVEDDFAAARDAASKVHVQELAIKSGVDGSKLGTLSNALLSADDAALQKIYRYAAIAVTYERAVNSKNLAQSAQYSYMSLMVGGVYSPTYGLGAVGTVATAPDVANATLSAEEMRSLLDSAAPDIDGIEQSLSSPTSAFNAACPMY